MKITNEFNNRAFSAYYLQYQFVLILFYIELIEIN